MHEFRHSWTLPENKPPNGDLVELPLDKIYIPLRPAEDDENDA